MKVCPGIFISSRTGITFLTTGLPRPRQVVVLNASKRLNFLRLWIGHIPMSWMLSKPPDFDPIGAVNSVPVASSLPDRRCFDHTNIIDLDASLASVLHPEQLVFPGVEIGACERF